MGGFVFQKVLLSKNSPVFSFNLYCSFLEINNLHNGHKQTSARQKQQSVRLLNMDISSMGCVICVQDYGLDLEAFGRLVSGCPQRVLELASSCCLVRTTQHNTTQHNTTTTAATAEPGSSLESTGFALHFPRQNECSGSQ